MCHTLNLLEDIPEEENIRFGFEEYAESVAEALLGDFSPTSAMAIDGEWGSGKSTLLKRVVKEIKRMDASVKTIELNACSHETIDIFASLPGFTEKEFPDHAELASMVASLMPDVLYNTDNMSPHDAKSFLDDMKSRINSIDKILSDVVKEKLVVFIDGLDGCRMDDMLSVLNHIELFFSAKNIIVVVAADMEKIRSGWEARHGKDLGEGSGYVDKLFQTKMSVPDKSLSEMANYITSLNRSYKWRADALSYLLPRNPRKVKLALNFIYSAQLDEDGSDHKWFRKVSSGIAWFLAQGANKELGALVRRSPRDFVCLAWLCSVYSDHPAFQKYAEGIPKDVDPGSLFFMSEDKLPMVATEFATSLLLEMVRICSSDPEAFRILQQYGFLLRTDIDAKTHPCISDDHRDVFEETWMLLEYVVQSTRSIKVL